MKLLNLRTREPNFEKQRETRVLLFHRSNYRKCNIKYFSDRECTLNHEYILKFKNEISVYGIFKENTVPLSVQWFDIQRVWHDVLQTDIYKSVDT